MTEVAVGGGRRRKLPAPLAGALAGALAAALVLAAWMARPVEHRPEGSTAEIMVTFSPDQPHQATAYHADGTSTDITSVAFERIWQPDRPVLMIVVTAGGTCSIQVGANVPARDEQSDPARLALCVWRAP